MSIPKTGNINLKAVRKDCGLSEAGPQKIVELSDRAGKTQWSGSGFTVPTVKLSDVRGSAACRSTNHDVIVYPGNGNQNPDAAARTNVTECTAFSYDGSHSNECKLSDGNDYALGLTSWCRGYGGADGFTGWVFVGKLSEAGSYKADFVIGTPDPSKKPCQYSLEFVGWSSGYYTGNAHYYFTLYRAPSGWTDSNTLSGNTFTADLAFPWITIVATAHSPAGNYSKHLWVKSMRLYKL